MDASAIDLLGRDLYDRERTRTSRRPLTEEYPDFDLAHGYAVQEAYARLRLAEDGRRLVGRKIGATSKAIQELFGISTPDFGQIFDDMVVLSGETIAVDELIVPMVEPEIAFILEHDLQGPGVTAEDVLEAVGAVVACIEIIDSRIEDWQIKLPDTVADNGSSSRCVFGSAPRALGDLDLVKERVVFKRDGEVIAVGTGEAVLGHPAEAAAWLANALAAFDRGLRAGEYVLSGSMTTAARVHPGERYEASFDTLGSVSCQFN